jgi:hypothetical protein
MIVMMVNVGFHIPNEFLAWLHMFGLDGGQAHGKRIYVHIYVKYIIARRDTENTKTRSRLSDLTV